MPLSIDGKATEAGVSQKTCQSINPIQLSGEKREDREVPGTSLFSHFQPEGSQPKNFFK